MCRLDTATLASHVPLTDCSVDLRMYTSHPFPHSSCVSMPPSLISEAATPVLVFRCLSARIEEMKRIDPSESRLTLPCMRHLRGDLLSYTHIDSKTIMTDLHNVHAGSYNTNIDSNTTEFTPLARTHILTPEVQYLIHSNALTRIWVRPCANHISAPHPSSHCSI